MSGATIMVFRAGTEDQSVVVLPDWSGMSDSQKSAYSQWFDRCDIVVAIESPESDGYGLAVVEKFTMGANDD